MDLRHHRILRGLAPVGVAAALVLASTSAASATSTSWAPASAPTDQSTPSPADEVLDSSPVSADAASQDAQAAAVDGNTVTVTGEATQVAVTLPVTNGATSTMNRGLVELSDNSSNSIVPLVLEDGSVAIHSVLNSASAPTAYEYIFDLPTGASLHLDQATGGAIAIREDGTPALFIAAPWATDANGAPVATHYTVQGNVLTQEVQVGSDTAFPVVADPWVGIDLVSSFSWTSDNSGWRLNVDPTPWARGFTANPNWVIVGAAGWDELYNKIPTSQRGRLNDSGRGQYICHMGFAGFDPQWNLELWKPARSLTAWVAGSCNG